MRTLSRIETYKTTPEKVFQCLDDLGVTGMHMTTSSMPMMGGKMNLKFITSYQTGPGSKYRWTGNVLWMKMDFTVEVIKWIQGKKRLGKQSVAPKSLSIPGIEWIWLLTQSLVVPKRSFQSAMKGLIAFFTRYFRSCLPTGIVDGALSRCWAMQKHPRANNKNKRYIGVVTP